MEDDWPPPEARFRSALWRAEASIERGEYGAASTTLADALPDTPPEALELVRGLRHLTAAGFKHREGDAVRARRQLAHARRRLATYLPQREDVDLVALLALVEDFLERRA